MTARNDFKRAYQRLNEDAAAALSKIKPGKAGVMDTSSGATGDAFVYDYDNDDSYNYDLTGFNTDKDFLKLLQMVKLPSKVTLAKTSGIGGTTHFVWQNKDFRIVTSNNPLTGESGSPYGGEPEKGYAGYMAIVGRKPLVTKAAAYIKKFDPKEIQHPKNAFGGDFINVMLLDIDEKIPQNMSLPDHIKMTPVMYKEALMWFGNVKTPEFRGKMTPAPGMFGDEPWSRAMEVAYPLFLTKKVKAGMTIGAVKSVLRDALEKGKKLGRYGDKEIDNILNAVTR